MSSILQKNRIRRFLPALTLISCGLLSVSGEVNHLLFDLNAEGVAAGKVTRIYGSTGDGSKGVPVAGGHDVDGDGFEDFAIAAISADPMDRNGAGEVALVFGNGTIGGTIDTAGFQAGVLKIAGDQINEATGSEIWMDDVNDDGLGDLIICRQNYTPIVGREGAGALTIIFGGQELKTEAAKLQYLDLRSPPETVGVLTITGNEAYDRLGIWTRTGDVTGDGIADIVVGADEVDNETETNRGAVYVIRGGSHLNGYSFIDLANFGATPLAGHIARVDPPAGSGNYHLGATCQVADLDGNGRAEVLAAATLNRAGASIKLYSGSPSQSVGGAPNGALFIAWDDNFLNDTWASGLTVSLESTNPKATRIDGANVNVNFGEEIIGGLDFDNDSVPDLFAGDLTADPVGRSNAGMGYVFYDAPSLKGLSIDMENPPVSLSFSKIYGPKENAIGADTVTQGDYDLDGIGDLVIGNPKDSPQGRISAGTMHVLYGQDGGWPSLIDLAPGNLPGPDTMRIAQIDGSLGQMGIDKGDVLCYSVAAGDVDGDGHTDILVNEMLGNGTTPEARDVGNLLVISGAALLETAVRYSAWKLQYFGVDEPGSDQNDDADLDGKNNYFEYLFALDPTNGSEPGHLPQTTLADNKIRLTYTRTRNIGLLTWQYEISTDLQTWNTAAEGIDYNEISVTDNGNGSETVTIELTANPEDMQETFLRVVAVGGN